MTQSSDHPGRGSDWQGYIRRLEERLGDQIVQLKVSLEKFMAASMSRSEIETEIISRVAQDTYQADMRAINERLTRMESSPQKLLGWLSLGVGCLGVLLSGLTAIAATILWLIVNYGK